MERKSIIIISTILYAFAVMFALVTTAYFGWNTHAESTAEMVCGCFAVLLGIIAVCVNMFLKPTN